MNKYDESIEYAKSVIIANENEPFYYKPAQDFFNLALEALQQAKECECGCEYCNNTLKEKPTQLFNIGDSAVPYQVYSWIYKDNLNIRFRYQEHELVLTGKIEKCPRCGKELRKGEDNG